MRLWQKEFFIVANSNAAPFVSDTTHHYYRAADASTALLRLVERYDHPAGLYAANAYQDADSYHKNKKPLATWRSQRARGK